MDEYLLADRCLLAMEEAENQALKSGDQSTANSLYDARQNRIEFLKSQRAALQQKGESQQ